jgi:ferredoxin
MATMIVGSCINCGACEPVCPGDGIRRGEWAFIIDSARCTECVGFYAKQQCMAVCPVESCVPDQERIEAEDVLFERALKLSADDDVQPILTEETSHFRVVVSRPWWKEVFSGLRN